MARVSDIHCLYKSLAQQSTKSIFKRRINNQVKVHAKCTKVCSASCYGVCMFSCKHWNTVSHTTHMGREEALCFVLAFKCLFFRFCYFCELCSVLSQCAFSYSNTSWNGLKFEWIWTTANTKRLKNRTRKKKKKQTCTVAYNENNTLLFWG